MLSSAVAGLLTGATLIIAIGAQNAYVLRQGITRSSVGAVVLVCAVSDLLLIVAGVGGIGVLVDRAGWLVDVMRWLGVAFLVGYAALSVRRAFRADALEPAERTESRSRVVVTALALTWLNPHVYLDTVLLLGSIASTHGDDRWWFAAGACVASVTWFSGLGYGARWLAPLLARPRAWQVLDIAIAAVMLAIAAKLATGG